MRTLLQIGEVAQLLGVTTKTIRHYQKVGLIQEPERTASGYRLFSVHDLLRVQRIRRLQALGLSLKQIKIILFQYPPEGSKDAENSMQYSNIGQRQTVPVNKPKKSVAIVLDESVQERALREVLQTLDEELQKEIEQLQARRQRIGTLLNETSFSNLEQLAIESPGFALAQELLGERIASISPEVMEREKRAWSLLDTFHWPGEYRSAIGQMVQHFANQPELLSGLILFSEQLVFLASLPEDTPEVEKLLEECLRQTDLIELLQSINTYSETINAMRHPFGKIFGELLGDSFSPAQWRFLRGLAKHIKMTDKDRQA